MGRDMAKYRESFALSIKDVSMIEEALSSRVGQTSKAILEQSSHNPFERACDQVQGYKQELAEIQELLGRLHNQKIWYRTAENVPLG